MQQIIVVFLGVIWIKMSNGSKCRKSTSLSCCLHDSSHAGECSWPMLVPKNVLIAHALQLSDPSGKGLWGGYVGVQGC